MALSKIHSDTIHLECFRPKHSSQSSTTSTEILDHFKGIVQYFSFYLLTLEPMLLSAYTPSLEKQQTGEAPQCMKRCSQYTWAQWDTLVQQINDIIEILYM